MEEKKSLQSIASPARWARVLAAVFSTTMLGMSANGDETTSYRCYEVEGAKIIADDGTYLGTLDDHYESDSIYNDYSDHGKTYLDDSLWNEYSEHGNEYSDKSAFNEYASNPPVLLKDGEIVGRLTIKDYVQDAIDPRTVGVDCGWADENTE